MFRGGFPADGGRAGDIGEDGGSSSEFVPEGCGGITCKAHCMGFAVEGGMEAFCMPVLGRSMWVSESVVDTVF